MPKRLLGEGLLDSDSMNSLSEESELFYRRVHQVCDDYGRFDGRPEVIRARAFPLQLERWPVDRIRKCLEECGGTYRRPGEPLIILYSVDNKPFISITNYGQKIRSASKWPAPPEQSSADCPQVSATCPQVSAGCEQLRGLGGGVVGDVVECVVEDEGGNGFRADEGYEELQQAYPKESGKFDVVLQNTYQEALTSGGGPAEDAHMRILEGVERMKASGTEVKYMPSLEAFLKKSRYLEAWEPEEPRPKRSRSAVERIRAARGGR